MTGNRRERWETLRNLPLEAVAEALGYARDRVDASRWKRPGSTLSVNGCKFFDHRDGRGGGGAIDLVMHAEGRRFNDAVRFLEGLAPAAVVPSVVAAGGPKELRLPPPCEAAWPTVRNYLLQSRKLPAGLVEACRRQGILHADRRRNAVFVCRDPNGAVCGAEIVGSRQRRDGSRFCGLAPGTRKSKGCFRAPEPPQAASRTALVESAVDALSLEAMKRKLLGEAPTLVASTAGLATTAPAWIDGSHALVCAYDADRAGDNAARKLLQSRPDMQRLRPVSGKDWNDVLKAGTVQTGR